MAIPPRAQGPADDERPLGLIDTDLSVGEPDRQQHGDGISLTPDAEWMPIAEAATLAGVSARRLRTRIAAGDLPARREGRLWYVHRAEIAGAPRRRGGRPLAPALAWSICATIAGLPVADPRLARRAEALLDERTPAEIAPALVRRAVVRRFAADGLEVATIASDPRLLVSTPPGLLPGKVRAYVAEADLAGVIAAHTLTEQPAGPVLLRVVADLAPFTPGPAPAVLDALDALDDPDGAVAAAGALAAAALVIGGAPVAAAPAPAEPSSSEPSSAEAPSAEPSSAEASSTGGAAPTRSPRLIAAVAAAGMAAFLLPILLVALLRGGGAPAASEAPLTLPGAPAPILAPAPPPSESVATRIRIAKLQIDLAVVSGDLEREGNPPGYPYCDVAQYLTVYANPGDPGAAYLYAHAQEGMFWPLLRAYRDDPAALIGMTVEVWSADGRLHRYEIDRAKGDARDFEMADEAAANGERVLILQTSTGPNGSYPRLQIGARYLETVESTVEEATPKAYPRVCG
jgi:hypothetical protein